MKSNFRNTGNPAGHARVPESPRAKALFQQALVLHQQGRLAQAKMLYEQALAIYPTHFDALHLLGVLSAQTGQYGNAVELMGRAIAINPHYADAHYNRGNALQVLGRLDEAAASYDQAIRLKPGYAEAYCNRGSVLQALHRLDEALVSLDEAVRRNPRYAEAYNNRGNVLQELKRFNEALVSYDHAIRCNANHAEAYNNRGNALQELKRFDEAIASYRHAIALKADYAEAHSNCGNALHALNRLEEALACQDRAIQFRADYADAHYNRGNTLHELNRFDEALASYDRAIALRADYADAYFNRGGTLQELRQFEAALASYDQAIRCKPEFADAYNSRGNALQGLKRLDEALASYEQALTLQPGYAFLRGARLHTRMKICDWQDTQTEIAAVLQKISDGEKVSAAFPVIALTDSLDIQRKAAEIWGKEKYPASHALPAISGRKQRGRIRVGYYSADFRMHPVSQLMVGAFEAHDKSRFECVAFSHGPDTKDEMRLRVERAFDRFIDVQNKSDQEVVRLSRDAEIDIAIDLGGFTEGSRPGIFAMRAAPIQATYAGYLGTLGTDYMDYLIADRTIIPDECRPHYAEKIVYLPSYQTYDYKFAMAGRRFTRAELGLPESGFVFCCFNNNYKITPTTFDAWMRILRQVEGSVLLLYADNKWVPENLRKEAVLRGIDAGRLVFAERLPQPEHLARYRMADLFLDTLPCNAGATASDALWAGLPLLTCTGQALASRVAASLLYAIGLPELVTNSREDYESMAVALAANPERLRKIRQTLEQNRITTPLFDTGLFTKRLEAAYIMMVERYQANLMPDHIYVAP